MQLAARCVDGTLKTHFHEQCGEETKAREGPSFGCRSSLSACGTGAPGRRGLKYAATPRAATENVSLIALSFYSGAI
jgi:hypothetical protein